MTWSPTFAAVQWKFLRKADGHTMKAANLFDVSGLVTIVTGGASGIGYGCAEAMVDNGALVTLIDLDREGLNQAVVRLTPRGIVAGELADVTDIEGLFRAFDAVAAWHGRIDVVFANAGISAGPSFLGTNGTRNPNTAFENIPADLWDRVLAVNLTSLLRTLQLAAKHMRPRRSGRIIVTSSVSASKTETYVAAAYVPAKAGVAHLVRQAALELARDNVQVNAIAPETNIGGGRLRDASTQAFFARLCPMGRIGFPDDIQGAALFLSSPASSFITGAEIVIDGGVLLGHTGETSPSLD